MTTYFYKAKKDNDEIVNGNLDVESEDIARGILEENGFVILEIKEKGIGDIANFVIWSKRITKKDIVIFSRQLSVMISSQIPLTQSLKIISTQTQNLRLQKIIQHLYTDVGAGANLSDTLTNYKNVFDGFYVNMIKSGERSGRLSEVLEYLANQLEKDYDLFRKVKGALTYPITVVLAMCIASIVVLVYVIPKLVNVFETMGVNIPFTTKTLILISSFIINFWWVIILFFVLIFFILKSYFTTTSGLFFVSKIKLSMPIFGKLFSYIYILQITRSLNTLLAGGVNLFESLVIVEEVVQDTQYKKVIQKAIENVRDGHSLASELAKEKLIPQLVTNMVAIGEQTGKLDYVLEKISDYYSKEVDALTNNVMTLIEPIVMIILGIGVALMVSAVFLPLYTIPSF